MTASQPDFSDIKAAASRIASHAVITPLLESPRLNKQLGGRLLIKPEMLQRTGSFKFRGACNAVGMLDESVTEVVAWSSGNHAQAVAAAATASGRKATIVMPADAPTAKRQGTAALGGEVVLYDRYTESREEIGTRIAEASGASIIPPYDFLPVIAGQGTIGMEIGEALQRDAIMPDQLVCCTGGGGLLAGVSIGIHHYFPKLSIYGAEPVGFDDFSRSLAAGERLGNDPAASSICDAIVTQMPGELTFPINQQHVNGGLVVSDDEVLDAMATAWQHLKLVIEPGGAVALAAALSGKLPLENRTTVIIASGGNVDTEIFRQALDRLDS